MKIINLTPHTVTVIVDESQAVFEMSGSIARVQTKANLAFLLNDIPVVSTTFGDVEDIPAPEKDTFFIVSRMVKSAMPNRIDLIVPDGVVRDEVGNIIGCTRFSL